MAFDSFFRVWFPVILLLFVSGRGFFRCVSTIRMRARGGAIGQIAFRRIDPDCFVQ